MNELEAIAREMRLPIDVLKLPVELLKQGYDPAFLGAYRPDELGQLDAQLLSRLKRALDYHQRLDDFKIKVRTQGHTEGWWNDSLQPWIDQAESLAEVDGITRNIRSRKSTRILSQKDPRLAKLGYAILTMQGKAPDDLIQWVADQENITLDEAKPLLAAVKHWLQVLLSEDAALIHKLGRQILKRSQISVAMLADQPESVSKSDSIEENTEASSNASAVASPSEAASVDVEPLLNEVAVDAHTDDELAALHQVDPHESESGEHAQEVVADQVEKEVIPDGAESSAAPTGSPSTEAATDSPPTTSIDPLLASFPSKPNAKSPLGKMVAKKVTAVSLRQLSPRQRRRRWLRSILQRYSKLKKPLNRLSHYQTLMLGRGQRSQLISLKMDFDRQAMVKMAREALCPGHHPLHAFLTEIADESLRSIVLPRLEQDVFAEVEELAHNELIEMAVRHLQELIQRRPVRGHRVLVIDAMGSKTAAVAVVDPRGHVDFTGDLSSVSSRPDIVAQNVTTLGQWIHQYKVTLVAISNGNTRKYLMQAVAELMKQSGESGLRWTIVDRTGADAYCETRQSLRDLPKIAKRHRAAVWLAWRLQDPLIEITKVDPARLRLGSYQRELPQETLEDALLSAVSASVAGRGIDVWNSHEKALVCLPGVDTSLASAIIELRDAGKISTREALVGALKEKTSETRLRQAIGYLRVFGSSQTLDGTMIHPDDYRLAERLIAAGQIARPAAAPDGWTRPTLHSVPTLTESAAETEQKNDGSDSMATSTDQTEASSEVNTASSATVAEDATIEATSTETASPSAEQILSSQSPTADEVISESDNTSIETASTPEEPSESTASTESTNQTASQTLDQSNRPAIEPATPENPTEPTLPPPLAIDVERLARSWQVGREKMKMVARCLQLPFADTRDALMPIPLLTHVPTFETLTPGMTAWGIVVGVADFGAFVDLGPDCSGLIHVSRLSRDYIDDPHEVVQMGDLLQVWVLNVDLDKKRIALSALPPGVEQARRPSWNESSHDGTQERAQGGHRPGERFAPGQAGSHRNDNRRPAGANQGGRSDASQSRRGSGPSNFGAPHGSRGPHGGGQGGRGGGQRDRNRGQRGDDKRRDSDTISAEGQNKAGRNKPAKPAPPITDAMQQGLEPMRSFSDLLQFYQVKRDEPSTAPVESKVEPSSQVADVIPGPDSPPESEANAS